MRGWGLTIILMMFIADRALGAEIYVSPTGDDKADGTAAAPFATIARARDKADELKGSGTVRVYLRGGTYYLTTPLVFTEKNSGTAASPIIYTSYPGEKAVISGGIKLNNPSWTQTTINGVTVQKTTIAQNLHVDQLFLNGKRQILARYPNFNANTKIFNGYASDALNKAQSCANPAEGPGYFFALHQNQWGGESYYFTGKTTYQWVGDNNRGGAPHNTYRMVENIFELLDAPGEWFYRKSTGELWFYPPAGTNLNNATIELASISQLIRFLGSGPSPEKSVKYIIFDNITFTHTYRSVFDSTGQFYELVTGSDWGIVRKAAVFMQNAEEIRIQNCLFDQLGGNGVFMSGYNRHNVVENCVFKNTGASCVLLMGLRSSIRCPNKWNTAGNSLVGTCNNDRTPGPLTQEYPAYCVVKNNLMDTLGVFEKQTSGVCFSASEFDTIRHNTIAHMPRAGINFCDGCWGGHIIDYNWVYDCVRETSDHGPFNAWGRDRNAIYGQNDIAASLLDARNPTIVRMNRFEAPPGMFGIDLDDQATNYYQEKNLLIGGGYKVQWNRHNKYLNGIILGGGNVQFHGVWGPQSNHYGARNIIYGTQTCLYQFCCGSNPTQVAGTGTKWDSNMVYSTAGTPTCSDWGNCNSNVYTWAQWTAAGLDKNSVVANPNFANPSKTWPGRTPPYLPVGDYNPTNTVALNQLKFEPFAMDSFGVIGITPGLYTGVRKPEQPAVSPSLWAFNRSVAIKCMGRTIRVTTGNNEDYVLSVVSLLGRIITEYKGSANFSFWLGEEIESGTYVAVINAKSGRVSQRFIVDR